MSLRPSIKTSVNTFGVLFQDALERLKPDLWYAPTRLNTTVAATGSLIDSIQDISGQGNALSSTGSDRPSFQDDGGVNVVRSNGKQLGTANAINDVTAETIIMVVKNEGVPSNNSNVYLMGSDHVSNYGFSYRKEPTNALPEIRYVASGTGTGTSVRAVTDLNFTGVTGVTNVNYRVIVARRSRALNLAEVSINGCVCMRTTHTTATQQGVRWYVGGKGVASERADFSWKEIAYFRRYLSDEDVASAINFLAGLHNITLFPAWTAAEDDYVRLAAFSKGYTSKADFTAESAFFTVIGHESGRGSAPKAEYYPMYLGNPYSDVKIYNHTVGPITNTNWVALDTGDASSAFAGANDLGTAADRLGGGVALARELQKRVTPIAEDQIDFLSYGSDGATVVGGTASNRFSPQGLNTVAATNSWSNYRKYYYSAMNEMVFTGNVYPVHKGTVLYLGGNEETLTEAEYTVGLLDLLAGIRGGNSQGIKGIRSGNYRKVYAAPAVHRGKVNSANGVIAAFNTVAASDADLHLTLDLQYTDLITGSNYQFNAYAMDLLAKNIATQMTGSLGKYALYAGDGTTDLVYSGSDKLFYIA